MAVNAEHVKMGRREPRIGIVEALGVLIALAVRHAMVLERYDWSAAKTAKLQELHNRLKSQIAEQAEAKDRMRAGTVSQAAAMSQAKTLKRQLDRALRRVFRAKENGDINPEAFEAGGKIGDSVPKMVSWLVRVGPPVAKLAPVLAPKMGGVDPAAEVERVRAALESADVRQELSVTDLPQETLEVYEAKGMAMEMIAELIDAGHSAFDHDATEAAKFNKDLIVRARKARPAAEKLPQ